MRKRKNGIILTTRGRNSDAQDGFSSEEFGGREINTRRMN